MRSPIQSVEVSYFVHATEDPAKLRSAVEKLISSQTKPSVEEFEGHFGNRILNVRFHMTGEDAAKAFKSVVLSLTEGMKEELARDISLYVDEHSALYVRFDKQALVTGSLAWGNSDPVRLKVKPRSFLLREGAGDFYRKIIEGGG